MMTLLKQSLATKIGCVPLFYREITSNAFLLCSADKKTQESRGRGGLSNWKNVFTMWRAKRASEFEEQVLFQRNWIFKWISSLQKSFLKLSPGDLLTLTLDARSAYPLSLSRWNIPKVFGVFKVTWYCCSTNELSWGKGCPRGSAHRFYIGIRKDYWLKVENIKTQENHWEVRPRLFL